VILEPRPAPISLYAALDERAEFETFLRSLGIAIRPGSVCEDVCLCLEEFLYMHERKVALPPEDVRQRMRRIVGMVDLVRKIQRSRSHPCFNTLVPHLRLLDGLDVDPLQNSKTGVRDQSSNKLFELLVAMAAMTFSPSVALERPRGHASASPDVIVDVDGVPWGLACKVLHSSDERAYRTRVADGIRQIERTPVRSGLVVINLKNLVDTDLLMPYEPDSREPYTVLETDREMDRRIALVREAIRSKIDKVADLVADAFSKTKARPYVIHYVPGVAFRRVSGMPVPAPFAQAWALEFTGAPGLPADVARVLDALNKGFQFG